MKDRARREYRIRRMFFVCAVVAWMIGAGLWLGGCSSDDDGSGALLPNDAAGTATAAMWTLEAALNVNDSRAGPPATDTPTPVVEAAAVASQTEVAQTRVANSALTATAHREATETSAAATLNAMPPSHTPTSTPTPPATPTPTPSPSADLVGAVNADPLNVRSGPGTAFDLLFTLTEGDVVLVLGRSTDGAWLKIRIDARPEGWVAAEFVDLFGPGATLPVVAAPPTPAACRISVRNELKPYAARPELGCPTGMASATWGAFQPFERGFLLWRKDTDEIYLFLNSGGWQPLFDRWPEGAGYPGRGDAPPGLQAPIRGFGYLWATDDSIYTELGWARDKEKGFCLLVQPFDRGFVMHSIGGRCGEGYNFADEPGFGLAGLRALDAGYWRQ